MPQVKAFTTEYPGLSAVLMNTVTVHQAFDPVGQKVPPGFNFNGLWDTGATNTVITQQVVDACGLSPIGFTNICHANGADVVEVYLVAIMLPNGTGFPSVRVTKGQLTGTDMLIGMDIIGAGDFAVTHANGKTVFTYRQPSTARIDFLAATAPGTKKQERNALCACNSGRKAKHCCGKA